MDRGTPSCVKTSFVPGNVSSNEMDCIGRDYTGAPRAQLYLQGPLLRAGRTRGLCVNSLPLLRPHRWVSGSLLFLLQTFADFERGINTLLDLGDLFIQIC